jgi:2-methylcitrate dehydratase
VDAAIELRDELEGAAIESVELETFKVAYEIIAKDPEKWAPKTRETADHSLPYIVAAALVDGTVTKESFSDERLRDPGLAELLGKTTLSEDDHLTEGYPLGIPNRVRVTAADGRSAKRTVSYPRGHAMNPMTDDELVAKFVENVADRWPEPQVSKVVDLVWDLEGQPDLEALMEAIRL